MRVFKRRGIKRSNPTILFHGGCHGCTRQEEEGVDECRKCQYFDADWNKPDLNNKPPTRAEVVRAEIKETFNC